MTFDGVTLSYYVDGALAGTASGPTFQTQPTAAFWFENQAGDASVKALFNDVRFYNYALTTAQVSVLSLAPGCRPSAIRIAWSYIKAERAF